MHWFPKVTKQYCCTSSVNLSLRILTKIKRYYTKSFTVFYRCHQAMNSTSAKIIQFIWGAVRSAFLWHERMPSALVATHQLPCQPLSVSCQPRQRWGAASGLQYPVLESGIHGFASSPRFCSRPDWGLVSLLAKGLVQSILGSHDVAAQWCPVRDAPVYRI